MRKILIAIFVLALLYSPLAYADTWGYDGISVYPLKSSKIVAPNGRAYTPIFSLATDINIGNPDGIYLFVDAAFIAERANPGVTTNSGQGDFDFTKRQFNLLGGLAIRPVVEVPLEIRFRAYSDNNLNRGYDSNRPIGYKDGFNMEARYYLNKTLNPLDERFYIGAGYYLTRELADTSGGEYKPAYFVSGKINYRFSDKMQGLLDFNFLTEKPSNPKELKTGIGLGYMLSAKNELRAVYERDFGLENHLPDRERIYMSIRHRFRMD